MVGTFPLKVAPEMKKIEKINETYFFQIGLIS